MSFNGRGKRGKWLALALNTPFRFSLLAISISTVIHPALAAESSSEQDMVVYGGDSLAADEQQDYAVKTTRAGTKMLLAPRDVPQSVSVVTQQRMKDQDLQNIDEVLTNATGVSSQQIDSERSNYFSRGFEITNFSYDDIPTSMGDAWNFGDATSDTAIYDRIEVVRGAAGLMTGAGDPGASVNMVRKRADSKGFIGNVSASYGSWNKQRYVADLAAPLNSDGSLRGRVIAGYQDQGSWLDRYGKRKKFLYGVMDADLTASTTLSLGWDYQQTNTANPTWGGLPALYSNGSRTHYDRHVNTSADWTGYTIESRKVFASLTHSWDNGWSFRLNGTHGEQTFNDTLLYVMGNPDATTGEGASGWGSQDRGKRTLDSFDSYASGPFALLGRQHQLMAGASYSRQHNATFSKDGPMDSVGIFNNHWDGSVAEPVWSDWYQNADDIVRQKSAYTAARLSLADPLSLILGARYTQYSTNGSSGEMRKYNTTPYGGVVYDITESLSGYASHTSIFAPQTKRSKDGAWLSPVTGKNYETGLKADWMDGRLTTNVAVFRIEQENAAEAIGGEFVNGSSEQAYRATKGAVSKGAEFEVNGAVTDNLQLTFSATRYVARDTDGRFNSYAPQTQLKLFSRYRLPVMPELTVGGGVNWQNRVYKDVTGPEGETQRLYQGSYPLVDLFAQYQLTKQLAVQANISNLFDREYYSYLDDSAVYGEPRNVSVSMRYTF
ncbi:ferric-rhodotorulic acid/ferric-coprogen receptor FhuE [Lelliottia sp. CFBP8978]|uniref:ferric-rhodotorulic acid/ferric-coprogen receptor FhuE n=1 Tax=Lelliottia sp. CFBP8978 TaxID=3096522 RepID=UPI002A6A6A0E|nr:ferric-rhodotorulic acid/ferric-coprogen receptor FhuE [Lelliottia sp. CFBP8978]MDY1036675.1 ferric-rhodotorulic acid/ferric-coprogen receptor FhuE [Lelliottia sp. CFBP8978]